MATPTLGSYEVDRISYTSGATNFGTIVSTSVGVLTFSSSGSGTTVQLKNISNPTDSQDAATKNYVDTLSYGLKWKEPVYLSATTSAATPAGSINIASAPFVFDGGIAPYTTNVRILLTAQTSGIFNGIYLWVTQGVAMPRTSDFTTGMFAAAAAVFVEAGDYADTAWVCTTDPPADVIGTDSLVFAKFAALNPSAAAGSDTQVQYNNGGIFGAASSFTFNKSTTVPLLSVSGSTSSTINVGTSTILDTLGNLSISSILATTVSTLGDLRLAAAGTSSGHLVLSTTNKNATIFKDDFIGSQVEISRQLFTQTTGPSFTSRFIFNSISASTLAAVSATTTGVAATLYVEAPIAGTNETFTNAYSIWSNGTIQTVSLNSTNITATSAAFTEVSATSGTFTYITVTSLTVVAPITFNNLTVTTLNVTGPSSFTGPMTATTGTFNALNTSTLSVTGPATFTGLVTATTATINSLSVGTLIGGAASPTSAIQFNGGSNNFTGTLDLTYTASSNTIGLGAVTSLGTVSIGNVITISATTTLATFNSNNVTVSLLPGMTSSSINMGANLTSGNINIGTSTTTGQVIIWSTAAATDQSTGALVIKGGLGVAKDAYGSKWKTVSDARFKENLIVIDDIMDPLRVLKKVESYKYSWKKDFMGYDEQQDYGLIAQQIETIPELENLVSNAGTEKYRAINYQGLLPIIISGLNQLSQKVDGLTFGNNQKEIKKTDLTEVSEKKHVKIKLKKIEH